MITYVKGDLLQSPVRVLVNTVNTVGVMGKGIAKDFKQIYPEMFKQYQNLCEKSMFHMGQLWLYKTPHKWILNFPTKEHWRQPSKIEYIEAGLKKFVKTYAEKGITSIAFPALGCGNGELEWETQVRPLMEKYLRSLPIDIYIYLYSKEVMETEHRNIRHIKEWLRSEPQSLAFSEVWEDIIELLGRKNNFRSINHPDEFKAYLMNDEIRVESAKVFFSIARPELVDLWQHVRSLGFCMVASLPGQIEVYVDYLMAILKELDYLRPIIISSDYEELRHHNMFGLQYIAPIEKHPGIFTNGNIHEVNQS